ncbi:hypothetical protein IMZ48_48460 [Candidatus Bathyarchaeota archaeon]|nr:hypothetical protein [Candidatus Bathyarchaeota archaeon]
MCWSVARRRASAPRALAQKSRRYFSAESSPAPDPLTSRRMPPKNHALPAFVSVSFGSVRPPSGSRALGSQRHMRLMKKGRAMERGCKFTSGIGMGEKAIELVEVLLPLAFVAKGPETERVLEEALDHHLPCDVPHELAPVSRLGVPAQEACWVERLCCRVIAWLRH